MRRLAFGLLSMAVAVSACSSPTAERRQLQPLPGVTTPTTVPATALPMTTLPGDTVPGDTVPATTVPGDTVPPTTAGSTASTAPTTSTASPPTGPRWAFGDFRSVPQLGAEPVRGSGCGADGTIGDVIPDGWWLGIVTSDSATRVQFDLVCVYFGDAADALIAECQATAAGSTCTAYFDETFWPVNRNTRGRTASKAGSYQVEEVADLCSVGQETRTGGITAELDWLLVENGTAVYLRRGCGTE